ncbi:cytochrome P450 [Nesidiocoris tenuis]|uniref:Cytochrome P450 n=1 Tax=Nesidiocoris tenuis TaxID=355587 RepID=A0ABN7ACT9_9HEMI|nr:cytochrome P450 [Nesidiocoris tenuis]
MLLDGVLILIAIIGALVMWLRWNYGYWKKRGIPYVEPTIIFGNMKEVITGSTNIGVVSQKIYNQYPGEPAIGFFNMRQPVLQLKDLDLIKAVLVTEFSNFRENAMSITKEADPILGRNPFFLTGDEWKEARKTHTLNHTANKLKTLFKYIEEVKDDMVNYIKKNIGRKFEAQDFSGRFTTDVVSSCVFGVKTCSLAEEDSEFRKKSIEILQMGWKWSLFMISPSIFSILRIPLINKGIQDFFYNLVKDMVEMRKNNKLTRSDFLQNLINEKEHNFTMMEMTAQTMTFFIDGYATSATEMSFLLYMLAIYPDIQDRVRNEINNVEKLDFDTVHHLPYLDAVFNETLRLYPAGVVLSRLCNQDTTLKGGNKTFEFKKNDRIEIPVFALHRDPEHFPEPLKFKPERFLNNANHPALLTFGAGPRACFGSRFAKTQIKTGVAYLVKNFRILPGTEDRSMPTVNNSKTVLLSPDKEMSVKFENL